MNTTNPHHAHILHVVIALDPGGLENGIVNVAACLDPERFRVSVCCLERAGAFAGRLPPASHVVVLNKQPGVSIKTIFKLRSTIQRLKPDIIHTHGLGPLLYSAAATFCSQHQTILHGEHRELLPSEQTPSKLMLRRLLYHRCKSIHTVSNSLRLHLATFGFPKDRLLAIPNGVDTQRFKTANKPETRKTLNLPEHALILGMLANFRPEKGHVRLIKGFNLIANQHKNLHLLLVGDGPAAEPIKAEVQASHASDRIHLVGHQSNPEPWYQAMDLLIVPSSAEGLSNAVLEAMACGVPVLASQACGNDEAIQHLATGFICNLTSPANIEIALKNALASTTNLQAMGVAARKRMVTSFGLRDMTARYAECYTSLTATNALMPS